MSTATLQMQLLRIMMSAHKKEVSLERITCGFQFIIDSTTVHTLLVGNFGP